MADHKTATLPTMKSKVEELAELEAKRRALTVQIEAERANALSEIVGTAKAQAEAIGISVAELVQAFGKGSGTKAGKPGAGSRAPAPDKYRNPKNPKEVWSGRGRPPKWVSDATKAGATLESLLIQPAPAKN